MSNDGVDRRDFQRRSKAEQLDWVRYHLRAQRKAGQMLIDRPNYRMMRELSVDKDSSSRWQQIARVPQHVFDEHLATTRPRQSWLLAWRPPPDTMPDVDLRLGDFRDVLADLTDVDAIITDPPYPAEYLPLLDDLAVWADKVLTPDGVLAVMIGQTYLPDVYRRLDGHRPYRWTMAYLTPGGQAVQVWPRKVNAFWKPVILYGGGDWLGDVARSKVNDNDKDHHHWGQSESGMADLIGRLTKPGDLVVDPFAGAGTTLLVAAEMGRRTIGAELDPTHHAAAVGRWS